MVQCVYRKLNNFELDEFIRSGGHGSMMWSEPHITPTG